MLIREKERWAREKERWAREKERWAIARIETLDDPSIQWCFEIFIGSKK
jgi:hypothetical protein